MITVFQTNSEYIRHIAHRDVVDGEVLCLDFLPSAFFPKDYLDYFFERKEHIEDHKEAAQLLWRSGKQYLKLLRTGRVQLGIELEAISLFLERGVIHRATSGFEATPAIRMSVLETILGYYNNLAFIVEPIPFIFRLVPPDEVILDVERNKTEQTIQGLSIKDRSSYDAFAAEYSRLKANGARTIHRDVLHAALLSAKGRIASGTASEIHASIKKALIRR